jgi:hypothetical protein
VKSKGTYNLVHLLVCLYILITYSAFVRYLKKKWKYNEAVHQLFIDAKKAYYSVKRKALYNILIELGISMKLLRLIRMYLTVTYSRVLCRQTFDIILILYLS